MEKMNPVQPQIQKIRYLRAKFDRAVIKIVNIETQVPINDPQHRDFHHAHVGKRLFAIVAMLGMITYLVWSLG